MLVHNVEIDIKSSEKRKTMAKDWVAGAEERRKGSSDNQINTLAECGLTRLRHNPE